MSLLLWIINTPTSLRTVFTGNGGPFYQKKVPRKQFIILLIIQSKRDAFFWKVELQLKKNFKLEHNKFNSVHLPCIWLEVEISDIYQNLKIWSNKPKRKSHFCLKIPLEISFMLLHFLGFSTLIQLLLLQGNSYCEWQKNILCIKVVSIYIQYVVWTLHIGLGTPLIYI